LPFLQHARNDCSVVSSVLSLATSYEARFRSGVILRQAKKAARDAAPRLPDNVALA
jgi:hypothetical protein